MPDHQFTTFKSAHCFPQRSTTDTQIVCDSGLTNARPRRELPPENGPFEPRDEIIHKRFRCLFFRFRLRQNASALHAVEPRLRTPLSFNFRELHLNHLPQTSSSQIRSTTPR